MNQADGSGIETPELDNTASLTLLFALGKAALKCHLRMDEDLRPLGMSTAKLEVLVQLLRAGESLPLRVLAERQQCVPSNMTTLVDRLEADGLVRRVDDPADRRSKRAELTPEGEEKARAGSAQLLALSERFDQLLGERGQHSLAQALAQLSEL